MFLLPVKEKETEKLTLKKCFAYTFLTLSIVQSSIISTSFLLIQILLKNPLKVTVNIKGICPHFATAVYCTLHTLHITSQL